MAFGKLIFKKETSKKLRRNFKLQSFPDLLWDGMVLFFCLILVLVSGRILSPFGLGFWPQFLGEARMKPDSCISKNTKESVTMEKSPLIPFVAIGRHDKTEGFIFETSFSVDEDSQDVFEKYAKYKLKSVKLVSTFL